jgi:GNAT superfamily N-acetyltransferase
MTEPPDPTTPQPGEWSRRTELRDGAPVLLRQIRPEDRNRLAEGMRQLSPASRYLRFHEVLESLSEEQLDYLTDVDHVDHEAIVAIDVSKPEVPGIGVARYIREPNEPTVAEAAVTVADVYQATGAGTQLLGALAARARDNGIEVFRNYVLDGNTQMLEVFDHLGAERQLETDGLWRVDLAVPEQEAQLPDSPAGRAFVEIARGQRRLASLFPPVWSRFKRARRDATPDASSDSPDTEPDAITASEAEFDTLREELDDWLRDRDDR